MTALSCSTLWGEELDKRDHEHDVRVLNGGVLP